MLSRLQEREFDVYYDRRDVGVLYLFVEGGTLRKPTAHNSWKAAKVGWEARAMRKRDEMQAKIALEQGQHVRARMEARSGVSAPLLVADPGAGKSMGIGDQLYTALGLPLRGRWSDRKPRLMGHLYQFGTQCLIVDDAHDHSLEHLMYIKEVTDQGRLQ